MILDEIYDPTGIITTVGIGTNLFLAKVTLDITAKYTKDCMLFLDKTCLNSLYDIINQLQIFG